MDEFDEYFGKVSVVDLIEAAADLISDDENESDSEYRRALVELLANVIENDHDVTKFLVAKLLHTTNKLLRTR